MPENPYLTPTTAQVQRTTRRSWLFGAAMSAPIGGIIAGLAVYWIYVEDPRTGTSAGPSLPFAVTGAVLVASALWAIAGAITRGDARRLLIAHASAALVVVVWIALGGASHDVVAGAVVTGWPSGGIGAAFLQRIRARQVAGD